MVRYEFEELYTKAMIDYLYDICDKPRKIRPLPELFRKLYYCKRVTIHNYK